MRLAGKTALVTGASRGIGAAVARAYIREGAAVAVHFGPDARFEPEAQALVRELRAAGGRALAFGADVREPSQVDELVAAVARGLGPIGVLVANAAASARSPWIEIDADEWRRVLVTNLDGLFYCARAVYPGMRSLGGGSIVTVSSVMVETGAAGSLHYVTSKAGIVGFTRALARELGPEGIRVNCVMPGAIRTEHELEAFPGKKGELAEQAAARQSIPRRGVPDDLAGAFVYLASAESDFVTGQVLNVDGGWVHY